jgi:AAA15 family ATPase/GTPase
MIIKFGVKNFFCFKEWMEIDFTTQTKGVSANSLCLKGANSSGKTNAIKSLAFLSHFCTFSFNQNPNERILFETFFNNNEPSEYFIDFVIDSIEYSYEAVLTKEKVLKEDIYKKEKRKTHIFSRVENKIEKNNLFNQQFPLRSNASIISIARQYEIKEIFDIFNFFDNIIYNVDYFGLQQRYNDLGQLTSMYRNNTQMLSFVKKQLERFDTGIDDIRIDEYLNEKNETVYYPVFKQKTNLVDNRDLNFEFQSSGTKSLYQNLYLYFKTLNNGGILCLDEFDINLHPDILPPLIKLFDDETNPKKAQLIFSTHNTDIIDMMGKYRTYLFNKENGGSYCYRLDELSENIVRNDRPISPLYKSGKLGGVPKI